MRRAKQTFFRSLQGLWKSLWLADLEVFALDSYFVVHLDALGRYPLNKKVLEEILILQSLTS